MKRLKIIPLAVFLSVMAINASAYTGIGTMKNSAIATTEITETVQAERLLTRLKDIEATDKSTLNAKEKGEMRKEVRSIKKQLKQLNGGIYLSASAVIIILLLLIILL
jgi:hypothetical protein